MVKEEVVLFQTQSLLRACDHPDSRSLEGISCVELDLIPRAHARRVANCHFNCVNSYPVSRRQAVVAVFCTSTTLFDSEGILEFCSLLHT